MKYLLLPIFCLFPMVFFAAKPGNMRTLAPSTVSSLQAERPVILIKPITFDLTHPIAHPEPGFSATTRKLNFKERLLLKLLRLKLGKHIAGDPIDPKKKELGKISMYLGIGAFVIVLVPVIGFLAFLAAIGAIILGIISLQGNRNVPGIVGLCLGSAFLILVAALVIALIALFN